MQGSHSLHDNLWLLILFLSNCFTGNSYITVSQYVPHSLTISFHFNTFVQSSRKFKQKLKLKNTREVELNEWYVSILQSHKCPAPSPGEFACCNCNCSNSVNSYSASHDNWCTETLWNRIMTAQYEGMGEVGSARYEPALLPPCPSIRALSYSNCQEIHPFQQTGLAL